MGIRHGDVSLGNMMWDSRREVGVLNDFDLAKFVGHTGASGQDNTGTLPFMALDLLSDEGLNGAVSRLYRHEAESFAWSLIFLHLATVKSKKEKNYTRITEPLSAWFVNWRSSRDAKKGLEWRDHDRDYRDVSLAYPNVKNLARVLHQYWLDRYNKQLLDADKVVNQIPSTAQLFGITVQTTAKDNTPYEELGDDRVFQEVVMTSEVGLQGQEVGRLLCKMSEKLTKIVWNAHGHSDRA